MNALLIVSLYLLFVLLLTLFAAWLVSWITLPRTRLRFRMGLYYHTRDDGTCHTGLFPQCTHGPQSWPWWRLLSISIVRIEMYPPTFGYRPWFYTRWGSFHFDIVFDRRKVHACHQSK